jgi:type 1 glutamine amidotransferase
VLARLDLAKLDLKNARVHRTHGDFALPRARDYGKGRVFYCTFGHRAESWDRPDIQKMYTEANLLQLLAFGSRNDRSLASQRT